MIFYDYILNGSGGVHRLRQTDTRRISEPAIAECLAAMADPAVIDRARFGVTAHWTAEPVGCLSVWADDAKLSPIAISIMLREPNPAELRRLHGTLAQIARPAGVEVSPDWMSMVVDYPCVITQPLPNGSKEQHMMAGDLIQSWAAAYFDGRQN